MQASATSHPAIGTTDELELNKPTISPITAEEDFEDLKLCSKLSIPSEACIQQLWDLPTLFNETAATLLPTEDNLETSSLYEKKEEKKEGEEEEGLSIPKLVRHSHSEPCYSVSHPVYLVSMNPLQDDLWESRHGMNSWENFVRETKTGIREANFLPDYTMKRNMRIAMICCAFLISGCELLSELRLCLLKWLHLPKSDDYADIEARLLSGDIKSIRQICEEFTPQESGLILEGIYNTHHSNLNEFHLS